MGLGKLQKKVRVVSLLMLFMMSAESSVTQYLGEGLIKVLAASPDTVTSGIVFGQGGAEPVESKYYALTSYLSGATVNITEVPPGKTIAKILHNGEDITPPSAIGKTSYNGTVNDVHSTVQRDVISENNADGTQGYYAWYRYIPGGSQGSNWYADVQDKNGNIVKISCGSHDYGPSTYRHSSSANNENVNGTSMPSLPGCTSTDFPDLQALSLGARKDQPFLLGATTIPDSVVTNVIATSAEVNDNLTVPIDGPDSYHEGYPRPTIITGIGVTPNPKDAGEYRVFFQQSFNDFTTKESERELNPGAPNGAKVITYYAAFIIDLAGKTYEYDNTVTVEYDTPPNAPNISSVTITGPSCVEAGSPTTFTFSFNNTGGTDITTPFQAKVLVDGATLQTFDYTGLPAGQGESETFTKTFGGTSSYGVSVIVDSVVGETTTTDNSKGITVTPKISCAAVPVPELITGDFALDKLTMPYGQSNWATPAGVTVTGGNSCKISQFGFIFEQNGIVRDYVHPTTSASTQGFSGPPYPGGMGEGSVNVTMKLVTSCGTTKVFNTKSFTITVVANNNPPFGSPGWFANRNTNNFPYIDEVVVGNFIDLGIVKDNMKTPAEPYDPEGDGFYPTWDFAGSSDPWIRNLADTSVGYGFYEHDERFSNIRADVLGYHTIYMKLSDTRGATSGRRSATINVVKPNPIAACSAPTEMKSNRPMAANAINADRSRSPMGRTIDHSKDEWTNKLPTYENLTSSDITVTLTLDKVYDSSGLASEESSRCNIIVHPDIPPVAKIIAPTLGIRGDSYDILNESYSPDGDNITQAIWSVQYDANNNSIFEASEPWTTVAGTLGKYHFQPTKVGKYKFKVRVVEEYGASAETESVVMDVINQAPEVSFDLSGNGPNPDPNPPTLYKASSILDNWTLVATNTNNVLSKSPTYNWQNENEALQAGAGKGKEKQIAGANIVNTPYGFGGATAYTAPLNDNGFGKNGVSIYKAMTAPTAGYSQPLYYPDANGKPAGLVAGTTPIESDKTHLYFPFSDPDNGIKFYALNKNKIGRYQLELVWTTSCGGCYPYGTYTPKWLDGNPYDYVLDYNSIPVDKLTVMKSVPYYHNGAYQYMMDMRETISRSSLYKAILAEKTIYMLFTKGTPTKVMYDDTGDESRTDVYSTNNSMACSFKALDGALIGCYDVPGTNGSYTTSLRDVLPRGDHLIFLLDTGGSYSPNGYFGTSATEIDMYGNIIKITPIVGNNDSVEYTYEKKYVQWPATDTPRSYVPAQYDTAYCRFQQTPIPYKGRDGDTYFYEEKQCTFPDGSLMRGSDYNLRAYPTLGLGIYVAKYDKNFKVVWRARTWGNAMSFSAAWTYDWADNIPTMIVNPLNNTIVTKTLYTVWGTWGDSRSVVNNTIDMNTGAVWGWGGPAVTGMYTNMHVDPYGNYQNGSCSANIYNQCSNISTGGSAILSGTVGVVSSATENVGTKSFSEYMGDGLLVSAYMYHSWVTGYNSPPYGPTEYWIDKGPVAEATALIPRYQFGQFVSPDVVSDVELSFNFKTEQNKVDSELFGHSFRMQDGMNRYALEFNGTDTFLVKYVGGGRTVLGTYAFNVQDGKSYDVKIRTVGNLINVWINKVNYFADISDNLFPVNGKFGAFSDKSFVNFSAMTSKPYAEVDLWSGDYAILDDQRGNAELKYDNIIFNDPELDPMAGSFTWTYQHTPMFIDNGGLSPMSGTNHTTGQPVFDRVGKWDVILKAKDDPAPAPVYKFPNMTFNSYRKNSNTFKKSIIVHRRPVAEFNVVMETNGNVTWTDTSFDPDRFNGVVGNFDPGYGTSRGVVNRRYWYIAPDGTMATAKLDKVIDSGTYTIGLQVQDEFGAWSWPVTNTLDVGLKPNNPPKAVLTYPNGGQDTPNFLPIGTQPTISWQQSDIDEGTTFTTFEVMVTQVSKNWMGQDTSWENSTIQSFSTQAEAYSWLATTITGNAAIRYKVKVRVKDETAWSAWSNEGWLNSIRPPTVQLTFPNGTYDSPSSVTSLRPTITWNQADLDTGKIQYQQVRVWAEDETLVASLDYSVPAADRSKTSDSWTMNADAPRGSKLKIQVRVMNNNGVWSQWSNIGWMTTNSPPSATMTDPSGTQAAPTVYNTTRPTFSWSQTDPDVGTMFSHFQIVVTSEDESTVFLDSGIVVQDSTSNSNSWAVSTDLPAGQKLRVKVRVFDGFVWSEYSPQTWMYINRAPIAEFDWTPKPVWEGDIVRTSNSSFDPDGDVLSYEWKLEQPDATIITFSSKDFIHRFLEPGVYKVTLTVSDGLLSNTIVKMIAAMPLTIHSDVTYTDNWLLLHEKSGHQTVTAPKDFYSGEIFIVTSRSSPAPVDEVTAWIDTTGLDGHSLYVSERLVAALGDAASFSGELFDAKFQSFAEGLPQGLQTIHFQIRYQNGVVKTEDISVNIIGNVNKSVGVHRVQ